MVFSFRKGCALIRYLFKNCTSAASIYSSSCEFIAILNYIWSYFDLQSPCKLKSQCFTKNGELEKKIRLPKAGLLISIFCLAHSPAPTRTHAHPLTHSTNPHLKLSRAKLFYRIVSWCCMWLNLLLSRETGLSVEVSNWNSSWSGQTCWNNK